MCFYKARMELFLHEKCESVDFVIPVQSLYTQN